MDAVLRIGEIARRTGVSVDTLRAWERRYEVLRPERTPGGHRLYTERDVSRVQQVQHLVNDGWSVAAAAAFVAEQEFATGEGGAETARALMHRLTDALDRFDVRAASMAIDEALQLLGPAPACDDVIAPVLRRVGDNWENDPEVIAREHLASQLIRSHLIAALPAVPGPTSRGCLAAGPEGEEHDLGLLMAACSLGGEGWNVQFLGGRTPTSALESAVVSTAPRVILLAATYRHHAQQLLEEDPRLDGALVVLGGPGFVPDDTARFENALHHGGPYGSLARLVEVTLDEA